MLSIPSPSICNLHLTEGQVVRLGREWVKALLLTAVLEGGGGITFAHHREFLVSVPVMGVGDED